MDVNDITMIDIHSHILPEVDDGASSVGTALRMLDDAYCDGTNQIVLTPHFARAYGFLNPKDKVIALVRQLTEIVENEGIPIRIYPGCEYLMESPGQFEKEFETIATLNGSRYLLVEFYFDAQEAEILRGIAAIRNKNLIPVLAHPERYECIQKYPENISYYIREGALLQMNKGSVLGEFGGRVRNTAVKILMQRGYAFAGSDAHNLVKRNAQMYLSYKFIADHLGIGYAHELFKDNPEKLLQNRDIRMG